MIPEAHVFHEMSGRLRLKIPSQKGDAAYFSALRERLFECPRVEEVCVNPQTASALILHNCDAKTIFQYAKKNELFMRRRPARARKALFGTVADVFHSYNRSIRNLTGGEVDIPSLAFLTLVVSGIYQIARGNLVMPAWYTAFYYALGVFSRGHVEEFDEGENLLEDFDDADGDGD
ncbi:MAG: hypothetical protein HY912_19805 [Desulfomonile tiedjei]|uniref:Uncharacterized protein n=1 Tax=Desulfomonile tiedjei TaxID=2358 RepID=A0A9D6Z561_9BACT|nr:hypothetical protein [Desulfomonile tiedjei]